MVNSASPGGVQGAWRRLVVRGENLVSRLTEPVMVHRSAVFGLGVAGVWTLYASALVIGMSGVNRAQLEAQQNRLEATWTAYQHLDERFTDMQAHVEKTSEDMRNRQRRMEVLVNRGRIGVQNLVAGRRSNRLVMSSLPLDNPPLYSRLPSSTQAASATGTATDGRLFATAARIEQLEQQQISFVTELEAQVDEEIRHLTAILSSIGTDDQESGLGGPLLELSAPSPVPVPVTGHPAFDRHERSGFERQLSRLAVNIDELMNLKAAARRIPLGSPIKDYWVTSRFGRRIDPITRRPALHMGLDLGATHDAPVLATAAGRITLAEWAGPYGRLVEIDHGNGIVSRFGHLRRISVKQGDLVDARDPIGLIGSSGRSTGTHLHYEIQMDGRYRNPWDFLRLGTHDTFEIVDAPRL